MCDTNQDRLEDARQALGADEQYTNYEEILKTHMLMRLLFALLCLVCATATKALRRGIHFLSEVPVKCQDLGRACNQSEAMYMMAEDYIYTKQNVLVAELVKRESMGLGPVLT